MYKYYLIEVGVLDVVGKTVLFYCDSAVRYETLAGGDFINSWAYWLLRPFQRGRCMTMQN